MHTEDPFYKGVPVEDIPSDNLVEFKIMEDIDGVHIQPWGESVKPQGHCTPMYVPKEYNLKIRKKIILDIQSLSFLKSLPKT